MKFIEWTAEQREAWDAWVAGRPESVREMCRQLPPDRLYRLNRHRCTLHSYNEDGTVTVDIDGYFNRVLFSRRVFGVKPSDLVECDLPAAGEDVGDISAEAGFSQQDIQDIIIQNLMKGGAA